jgi:hypothetical protein
MFRSQKSEVAGVQELQNFGKFGSGLEEADLESTAAEWKLSSH